MHLSPLRTEWPDGWERTGRGLSLFFSPASSFWRSSVFGSGTFFTAIRNPLFIAILAALAWGVRDTMKASKSDIRDLRLLAPIELFQAAAQSGGRVFVNPRLMPTRPSSRPIYSHGFPL